MEFLTSALSFLSVNGPAILDGLLKLVGAAAVFAAFTANTSDDKIVDNILQVINKLAFNFGKAANDPDQS